MVYSGVHVCICVSIVTRNIVVVFQYLMKTITHRLNLTPPAHRPFSSCFHESPTEDLSIGQCTLGTRGKTKKQKHTRIFRKKLRI